MGSFVTLTWMIEQIHAHTKLRCDLDYVVDVASELIKSEKEDGKAWGCGECKRTFRGSYRLLG